MKKILALTAFAVIGGGVLNGCNNAAPPVRLTNNNAAPSADSHNHADTAPRIALTEAKTDFDAGNAVFVDTRPEAVYRTEHVKGAINIPIEAVELRYTEIPPGKKIIAYCS